MPDVSKKWLRVIGISEDGWDDLATDAKALLYESQIVLGGERHLKMIPADWEGERIVWSSPIREAVSKIVSWHPEKTGSGKKVAVMASGDPLCYGIATKLLRHIPIDEMWIKPALSTFSLICSRVGWSLPDIETLTLHGRPLEMLYPFVQSGAKLAVLSKDSGTPKEAAKLLGRRGFGKSEITVLEHLGGAKEKIFSGKADSWNHQQVAELNAMAIECIPDKNANVIARIPGLPDDTFVHDGQLTKREVRAVALSKLMPIVDQVLWDVGAGCGSVAIEWMRSHPRCMAAAVEKSKTRLKMIEQNAGELGVPMLQIVSGTAPQALEDLPAPDAIFIGGGLSSTENSGNLLEICWKALNPGGRMVAHAVTFETEQQLLNWQKINGGDLTRISISRADSIGKFQGWKPFRPVTQLAAIKEY
ncbi:MAG: Precorrin-6Y C(5,15)-methyltransferase [decarboxylating] [Deltaproteobacteria bacterium]|jgi:precorrin-6Y C5,15-methyltransferase (decarboxylating)|nr:Precorrin-6Y C(5,15)-methyltransferase [decarboxylating] [Deltaproteobacteria bacterium]